MIPRARLVVLGALSALLLLGGPLEAQRGPEGRRGMQNREQLEQRIRAQMGRMMRERLGLTDEQAEELSAVVRGFDQRRRSLFRQEQATRRRAEALLLEESLEEDEAAEVLARMGELRHEEAALFAEEQEALLEVISPTQLLQLHQFREQIGRRIRELRRGRGSDGTGRRGMRGDTGLSRPGG